MKRNLSKKILAFVLGSFLAGAISLPVDSRIRRSQTSVANPIQLWSLLQAYLPLAKAADSTGTYTLDVTKYTSGETSAEETRAKRNGEYGNTYASSIAGFLNPLYEVNGKYMNIIKELFKIAYSPGSDGKKWDGTLPAKITRDVTFGSATFVIEITLYSPTSTGIKDKYDVEMLVKVGATSSALKKVALFGVSGKGSTVESEDTSSIFGIINGSIIEGVLFDGSDTTMKSRPTVNMFVRSNRSADTQKLEVLQNVMFPVSGGGVSGRNYLGQSSSLVRRILATFNKSTKEFSLRAVTVQGSNANRIAIDGTWDSGKVKLAFGLDESSTSESTGTPSTAKLSIDMSTKSISPIIDGSYAPTFDWKGVGTHAYSLSGANRCFFEGVGNEHSDGAGANFNATPDGVFGAE